MAQQPFFIITPQSRWINADGTPTPEFFRIINALFLASGSGQSTVDLATIEAQILDLQKAPYIQADDTAEVSTVAQGLAGLGKLVFSFRQPEDGVVGITASGAGITATPNPITRSGTLTVEWNAGTVNSLATGIAISGTALTPTYQAGSLTTFGVNFSLSGGTLNVIGITSGGSPAAGAFGEYVPAVDSGAGAITSGAATTFETLPLTAGEWDVQTVIEYTPSATGVILIANAGISLVTNTLGGLGTYEQDAGSATAAASIIVSSPVVRVALSGTTNVYGVAFVIFSGAGATCTAQAFMRARRVG